MKKVLAGLLVLVMALGLSVGCLADEGYSQTTIVMIKKMLASAKLEGYTIFQAMYGDLNDTKSYEVSSSLPEDRDWYIETNLSAINLFTTQYGDPFAYKAVSSSKPVDFIPVVPNGLVMVGANGAIFDAGHSLTSIANSTVVATKDGYFTQDQMLGGDFIAVVQDED